MLEGCKRRYNQGALVRPVSGMARRHWISLLALTACIFSAYVQADDRPYYMWRDAHGVLNISQVKPRDDGGVVEVPADTPPEISRRPGHDSVASPPAAAAADGEDDEVEKANASARDLNCQMGHLALEKLNAHKYIYMRDATGWWRKLTAEQQQEQVEKAQKLVADNCPPE